MNYAILVYGEIKKLKDFKYKPSVRSYMTLRNCRTFLHMLRLSLVDAKEIMYASHMGSFSSTSGSINDCSDVSSEILGTPGK